LSETAISPERRERLGKYLHNVSLAFFVGSVIGDMPVFARVLLMMTAFGFL